MIKISKRKRPERGFTLIELLITMSIFVIAIMLVSNLLILQLNTARQQSAIAETNIEGIIGLEILRRDIEHAGYGLPWNVIGVTDTDDDGDVWEHLTNYHEAKSMLNQTPNPAIYNDGKADTGTNGSAPRAIVSGNDVGMNGSDYLVIKSTNVAQNVIAQKWTLLYPDNTKKVWIPVCENVNRDSACNTNDTVKIIVISPGTTDTNRRSLVVSPDGRYYTQYDKTSGFQDTTGNNETRFIYGISSEAQSLRMPFNRADYSIRPATDMPLRCAPGTGVLYKATVNHSDGEFTYLPLLDCVADMQILFRRDINKDGSIDATTDDISNLSAIQIREQVKEVIVYIIAQEGQKDINYNFPNETITVGSEYGLARNFDLKTQIGPGEYKYYRWKVYKLIVKPNNLG